MRFTCKCKSSLSESTYEARLWETRTIIDKTIASSDTTIVKRPKGNGSKGLIDVNPRLILTQTANQIAFNIKNVAEPKIAVSRSENLVKNDLERSALASNDL